MDPKQPQPAQTGLRSIKVVCTNPFAIWWKLHIYVDIYLQIMSFFASKFLILLKSSETKIYSNFSIIKSITENINIIYDGIMDAIMFHKLSMWAR